VRRFRKETGDNDTPILLMGYYNLVYQRGAERFCKEAAAAGIDGFILVDLPPEEADELKPHAVAYGLDTVLLTAPTTDDKRLPAVLKYSSGFVYFVSVLGITGTKSASEEAVRTHVERIKRHTKLPVGVGFGIKTPDQAAAIARHADAAVVGSAIVDRVKAGLDDNRHQDAGSGRRHCAPCRCGGGGLRHRRSREGGPRRQRQGQARPRAGRLRLHQGAGRRRARRAEDLSGGRSLRPTLEYAICLADRGAGAHSSSSKLRSATNGLVLRSQPKVEVWPWPGTKVMSSPSGHRRLRIEVRS